MSRWRKIDRWPRFYTYTRRRTRETWLGSKPLFWIQQGWAHQKRLLHLADIFLRHYGCGYGFAPSTHVFDTLFACFVFGHIQRWPRCFFCGQNAGRTGICVSCVFVLREQLSAIIRLNHWRMGKNDGKTPVKVKGIGGQHFKNYNNQLTEQLLGFASSIRLEHRTPVLRFLATFTHDIYGDGNVKHWFTLNHSMSPNYSNSVENCFTLRMISV